MLNWYLQELGKDNANAWVLMYRCYSALMGAKDILYCKPPVPLRVTIKE